MAVGLDGTDCRIVRSVLSGDSFGWQPDAQPVKALAARLGVHRNTVQRRVDRLEGAGVLFPLRLGVSPGLLSLVGRRVYLETPTAPPPERVAGLFDLDGLFWVALHPKGVSVTLFAEDEARLASRTRLGRRLLGARASETDGEYPAEPVPGLSTTDRRILEAATRSTSCRRTDIARLAGLHVDTVAARLDKLREERSVRMRPCNPLAPSSPCLAYVRLGVPAEQRTPRLLRDVTSAAANQIFQFLTADAIHFYLYGKREADLAGQARALAEVARAGSVRFRRVLRISPNPAIHDWCGMLLRRQAGVLERARRRRSAPPAPAPARDA